MDCPRCQAAIPEGAKFCMECGNPLFASCPECGTELPAQARFCLNCGHQLAEPEAASPSSSLEQYIPKELLAKLEATRSSGGLQGERRVVTMLFCDVTGSTAAAEQLDPEEWAQIMNGAFEHLIAPVYRYEGTLARLMGDAILAFFGAPIAHEDDPHRAVLAGLEISQSIGPYRDEVRRKWGVDFEVRVGINTGLVVMGEVGSDLRVEYTAMGDAINVAARMEASAAPGTVLIAADTQRLVAPLFEFEDLGLIDVRGKSEPVGAYRVLHRREAPLRERGIEGLDSPMVGRDREMDVLRGLVTTLSQGRGQIVSVMGEAGLGKSRLIAELRHPSAPGATEHSQANGSGGDTGAVSSIGWYEGRSLSYETSTPYGLFISLFSTYFGLGLADTDEEKYNKIRHCLTQVLSGAAARSAPFMATMLGVMIPDEDTEQLRYLQPPQVREKIFAAIRGLVEHEAARQPLLLVFEDLHWADPTSLDLLDSIMPLVDRVPLMILGVFRPVRQDPGWRFHEAASRDYVHRYTTISLEPLDENDSRTLVGNLLEIEDLPERVRSLILAKAEGNPFFVEEVIRSLLDAKLVVRENSHWRATQEIVNIALPDTLAGVITARLDRLNEDSKRVVQTASVIGREFQGDTLTEVYENVDVLDDSLIDLQRRELIRETSLAPNRLYMYKHALTQEAAYRSLLLSTRRDIHLRVALCLERTNPEQAHNVARHFLEAQEQARALPYLVEAADQAGREYSTSEAIGYYTQALKILDDVKDAKLARRAYEGFGGALSLGGDVPGAVDNYHKMFHAGQEFGDLPMQVSAMNKLGFVTALMQGQFPEAEEHLAEAGRLARQCGDLAGLAEFHTINCYMTVPFGKFDEAVDHLSEVAKIGQDLAMDEPRLFGMTHTANTLTYMTRFEEAEQVAQEALQLAKDLGNRKWQSELLGLSIPIHHMRNGDLNAAWQSAETAADLAAPIGAAEQEGYAELSLGQISWLRGEYEQANGHYQRTLQAGRTCGLPFIQVAALCGLGTAHMDISSQLSEQTIQFHSQAKELIELPLGAVTGGLAWADLGYCLLAGGNPEQANEFFQKGLTVPTAFRFLARPMLLVGAAFVALGREDVVGAAELVKEAREFAEQRAMKHFYPLLSLADAQVHLASGDSRGALASFNQADDLAVELGMRPLAWQSRGGAAKVLSALGREAEASEKRAGALSLIHEIGGLFEDQSLRSMYLEDAIKKLG